MGVNRETSLEASRLEATDGAARLFDESVKLYDGLRCKDSMRLPRRRRSHAHETRAKDGKPERTTASTDAEAGNGSTAKGIDRRDHQPFRRAISWLRRSRTICRTCPSGRIMRGSTC